MGSDPSLGIHRNTAFQTTSLSGPTALAFTPDGRMLITLQGGNLRVAENGAVLPSASLTENALGDGALRTDPSDIGPISTSMGTVSLMR